MTIKEARKVAGLSQIQMSEKLGIPRRTIEDWERGINKCPDYVERLIVEKLLSFEPKTRKKETNY